MSRIHGRRPWCWLLLAAACLPACTQNFARVFVHGTPANAATLETSYKIGSTSALLISVFTVRSVDKGEPFSFGVLLPHQHAHLVIGAGALDEQSCLLATGSVETDFLAEDTDLDLELADVTGLVRGGCGLNTLEIFSVYPPEAPPNGGTTLTLRGWAFRPTSQVSIGNHQAINVVWRSRVELKVDVPENPGARGPVPIKIVNQDGNQVVNDQLFSYR